MATRLIFGCGYLGRRVARLWQAQGDQVYAVTRDPRRAAEFSAQGWQPIIADVTAPDSLRQLPSADSVLFAVGYDRRAGRPIHDVYVDGLGHVLAQLQHAPPARLIYISSTGVYSQDDGQWVDEDSACEPQREGGRACWAAEQLLAASALRRHSIVLRMAGIYGPGRIPRQAELMAGVPIAAVSHGYLNLIHVDDAAAIVLAAVEHAQPPRTYVVADGHPVLRGDYYTELARLLGAPPPRFAVPPADSPQAARAAADKRINIARLRAEIPYVWQFPSYRTGLSAILQHG